MGNSPYAEKSSLEEIERRFDMDVERFSNLESGQQATIDAPLAMELITRAAVASSSPIHRILDIGCGAGNNTLKLLQYSPGSACDLVDLSLSMLNRARQRLSSAGSTMIRTFKGDFRSLNLEKSCYDVILAAAVLHHLRDDADWEATFAKIYDLLGTGGSVWITDLVSHESAPIQEMMWKRYGEYLTKTGGSDYRDLVFGYIEKEDSPRSVTYQLALLRRVGFRKVELLHKNSCFAAFGGIK